MSDATTEAGPVTASEGRLAPLRLARATPAAVWLLCALQFLLAVGYAVAVPLLHAPDEHAHVDRILAGDPSDLDPLEDDADLSQRTIAILPRVRLHAIDWRVAPIQPWGGLEAAAAPPREDRPAYPELAPAASAGILNNTASHPPLYYVYEAGGLEVLRASEGLVGDGDAWSWDRTLLALRVLSALLVLPIPWLAYWTAVRLARRRSVGLVAATVPVAIPQLAHITGSVNNDALLVLTTSVVALGCVWIATGDRSLRTGALTGGAAGLALLTKIFALGAPLWIGVAYAVAWLRHQTDDPGSPGRASAGLAIAAVSTVVFGGWYVLRLLVLYGTPAPRPFAYPQETIDPEVGFWLTEVWLRTSATFWGFFGIEQFHLPRWLILVLTLAVVATIVAALVGGRWAAPLSRIADVGVLLLPVVTAGAMMLYASWQGYIQTGLPVGLHGRYLFVGLVGVAAAVGLGIGPLGGRPATIRWVAISVFLVAVVVQALGAWTVVRSFYAGPDLAAEVRALLEWSPVRPRYLGAIGALAAATGSGALWTLRPGWTHDAEMRDRAART
ncbi:MAG: phospholipid carrier-dependent glycosyltransferase [Actinobacteria bacterium]|nr:phospholipid carrier-dependent glycosyltransferase [Actinomycetota bacterium]